MRITQIYLTFPVICRKETIFDNKTAFYQYLKEWLWTYFEF
ncbi:hypothetical protein NB720_004028 [Pantoea ananatis]|jgi:hypothetical protein|nr:hypothetical protein [Pantoea ananatis]MCW0385196.1 hypothetical protein [Pantoea ananatis]MCW0430064.1 hypothetical protein [Pantoea ananatis]